MGKESKENIREEEITMESTTEAFNDECRTDTTAGMPGDEPCDSESSFTDTSCEDDGNNDEYYDEHGCRCVNGCCEDRTVTITMKTAAMTIGAAILAGIYIGKLIFKKN